MLFAVSLFSSLLASSSPFLLVAMLRLDTPLNFSSGAFSYSLPYRPYPLTFSLLVSFSPLLLSFAPISSPP